MSPSTIVSDAIVLVLAAIACFIAFKALEIRRALVDGDYRSRALWTAIGALTLVAFAFAQFDPAISGTAVTYSQVIAAAVFYGFIFIGLYGWLIANTNVAVRADYFNRDILFWKRGGRQTFLVGIVVSFIVFNLPSWWFAGASLTYYNAVGNVADAFTYAALVYATIVLFISYRRVLDKRIKSYTLWAVLSIVSVFVALFLPGLLSVIGFLAFLYFMYRAVGSLAIRTSSLQAPNSVSAPKVG